MSKLARWSLYHGKLVNDDEGAVVLTSDAIAVIADLQVQINKYKSEQREIAKILGCTDLDEEILMPSNLPNVVRDRVVRIAQLEEAAG